MDQSQSENKTHTHTLDKSKPRGYDRKVDEGGRVRDKQLRINLTADEKATLDKNAADLGITKQQFILNALSCAVIYPVELCDALKNLSRSIADTNIIFQKELFLLSRMDAEEAAALVKSQKKEMEELWQSLRHLIQKAEAVPGQHYQD